MTRIAIVGMEIFGTAAGNRFARTGAFVSFVTIGEERARRTSVAGS